MNPSRPFISACLFAALLASAAPALAKEHKDEVWISVADSARRPFVVSAPADGATLAAGSTAEVAWSPRAGFDAIEDAEEWEAFLSVDGGKTYPLRITPHLDLDVRRIRWDVPHLPTRDARLLLRFGDERRETAFELPLRFTIEGEAKPALDPPALALHRGEPALPEAEGVISWVEGDRRGLSTRQVSAAQPAGMRPAFELPPARSASADLPVRSSDGGPLLWTGSRPLAIPALRIAGWSDSPDRRGPPLDLLALHQRRNE